MADEIKFDRTPYTVTYQDLEGKTQKIRRTPPPKLHPALPTDRVILTRKKNDDYDKGDDFEVVNISPRQPNVLQIRGKNGTTFIDHYDIDIENVIEIAPRDGVDPRDKPVNNKYLLWP